jgi:hypothetical protein
MSLKLGLLALSSIHLPALAQLKSQCIRFCVQWNQAAVNVLEIVSQPEIPCPSWIHEGVITLLEVDTDALNAGECQWQS